MHCNVNSNHCILVETMDAIIKRITFVRLALLLFSQMLLNIVLSQRYAMSRSQDVSKVSSKHRSDTSYKHNCTKMLLFSKYYYSKC